MPIHEFYCPDNNRIYSFYARTLAVSGKTPRCPENPTFRMERLVSPFSVTGRAKEKTEEPPGGGPNPDDPRMEAAFAEMEREFSGMDEENPDPRLLARMMRKMTALTGEKMPDQMEDMIRRMEAGEDPEKLEEEYGDAFDEMESGGMGEPGTDEPGEAEGRRTALKERMRRLRGRPARDPVLYEMSEFVD
jgi:hypothetical protein